MAQLIAYGVVIAIFAVFCAREFVLFQRACKRVEQAGISCEHEVHAAIVAMQECVQVLQQYNNQGRVQ